MEETMEVLKKETLKMEDKLKEKFLRELELDLLKKEMLIFPICFFIVLISLALLLIFDKREHLFANYYCFIAFIGAGIMTYYPFIRFYKVRRMIKNDNRN